MVATGATYVIGAVGADSSALRTAVTLDGVRAHQAALQAIATANGGTRVAGAPGHVASANYVYDKLVAAGYIVTKQVFTFPFFEENSPAEFAQTQPDNIPYSDPDDFSTMTYSGSGNIVSGTVQNAGGIIAPTPEPSSTSGCTAADFVGFVPGNVALIQRGGCTFAEKALNAQIAFASAVIIFNEGNPGRIDNFGGTLGGTGFSIPVISTSWAIGSGLAAQSSPQVHIATDTTSTDLPTVNVIAETPTGRSDRVVVVGAHLDSVAEGPGINDNGSGSAAILEIALQMKALNIKPRNKVRFAWWSAEEAGLLGSAHYVSQLTKRQITDIAVNLNFDMIGSPNFVRQVYDGDGSDTPDAGPNGSAIIEDVFNKYFTKQGLTFEATAFDGRSDYGPFIDAGIPAGGLFTGAEDIKTAAQFELFGGTVDAPLDPCYHQDCDTFANNNNTALDQMSDATADVVLQFAMTTSSVKGTSKANDRAVKYVDSAKLLYKGGHLQR